MAFTADERNARFIIDKYTDDHDWIVMDLNGKVLMNINKDVPWEDVKLKVEYYYLSNFSPEKLQLLYIHPPVNGRIPNSTVFRRMEEYS